MTNQFDNLMTSLLQQKKAIDDSIGALNEIASGLSRLVGGTGGVATSPAVEAVVVDTPSATKRGPGRPRGSHNKPAVETAPAKRSPGRPKKQAVEAPKRSVGRPKKVVAEQTKPAKTKGRPKGIARTEEQKKLQSDRMKAYWSTVKKAG